MPVIRAFRIPGLYMFIPSGDHLPPHFHIQKHGAWMIKVDIMACTATTLSYDVINPPSFKGLNSGLEKAILQNVINHRDELLEEFENALPK